MSAQEAVAVAVNEVLVLVASAALGIAVSSAIIRYDLARLRGKHRARAWPDSSLWLAVVMFSPLCVPWHFIRTRRNWAGLDLGLFWLVGAALLVELPLQAPLEGFAVIFCLRDLLHPTHGVVFRNKPP